MRGGVLKRSQEGQLVSRYVWEALKRIGKLEHVPEASLIQSGDGWNYRHRARLHCFFQAFLETRLPQTSFHRLHPWGLPCFWPFPTASWRN